MENKVLIKPLSKECIDSILNEKTDSKVLNEYGLNQCIIYNYDSLVFGDLKDVVMDFDNIMEARFFSDEYEISLLREDNEFTGTIFKDDGFNTSDIIREKRYIYYKKGTADSDKKYDQMEVKKYIEYDEDGQAYIAYIKPCRFLRGNK